MNNSNQSHKLFENLQPSTVTVETLQSAEIFCFRMRAPWARQPGGRIDLRGKVVHRLCFGLSTRFVHI